MSSWNCRHVARHGTSHVSVEWYWYTAITHTMSTVITGTEIHPLMPRPPHGERAAVTDDDEQEEVGQERPAAEHAGEADADRERVQRQRRGRGEVTVERRQGRRGAPAARHGWASTASALRARLRPTAISVHPARNAVSVDGVDRQPAARDLRVR